MCNEYNVSMPRDLMRDQFSQLKIPFDWADPTPNRDLSKSIRPTNRAPIIRPIDPANPAAGLEGLDIRWKMVPFFYKGALADFKPMTTNAKIETVDTTQAYREAYKSRRCLVPLTSFVEYDEPPGWKKGDRKRRWEIGWAGGGVRYFAGLWARSHPTDFPEGLDSYAFVTGPAGPDVAPVHNRQPPVLTLEEGMEWLRLDGPGKAMLELLRPPGTFTLTERPRDAA